MPMTFHAYDSGIVDKIMVLEFENRHTPQEMEKTINLRISEMGYPKILSITSSLKSDGKTLVLIHHLGKKEI